MFRHGINSEWWCSPWNLIPGPFGMIFTLLFWGLILYLAIKAVQFLFMGTQQTTATKNETAEALLQNRYARGEINRNEFHQMQKDLR